MLEQFYQASILYYLSSYDWLAMLIILGEWSGFVTISYYVLKNVPWYLSPIMVTLFGGAWLILYEAFTFDLVFKLGYLKGVVP